MNRRNFLSAGGMAALAAVTAEPASAPPPRRVLIDEPAIDPERPIVDAHRHMYDAPSGERRLLPEILAEIERSGHNITHHVFVQSNAMYRADGPEAMKPVGEIEFINGVAAMSASGRYGPRRIAAAFVGYADMTLGARVKPVLEAEIRAGGDRLRGVRFPTSAIESDLPGRNLGALADVPRHLLEDATVREGIACCAPLGLAFEALCFHTQLREVAALAAAFPDTLIIFDHIGMPLDITPTTVDRAGKRQEFFEVWSRDMPEVAKQPNVVAKIGCLAMDLGVPPGTWPPAKTSAQLAEEWKPYVERTIELLGPDRCMFEGDGAGDGDRSTCTYGVAWNAFKRITAHYSESEKTALFSGTAKRIFRIG